MRNVMERPNPSQAVLVGGAWGAVEDWQWVRAELALRQIVATVVDLPSLRSGDATRGDDVAAVRTVMDSSDAAVILVGWSYGGALISDAAFGVPGVARLVYVAAIPESEPRLLLATGSYIGEGFDDAGHDTLFLAMPNSWKGTLQQ